jgi:hypothetical protein
MQPIEFLEQRAAGNAEAADQPFLAEPAGGFRVSAPS